jgi:formyltetrahydrofolate deformylase
MAEFSVAQSACSAILTVDCPDRPGIVAAISGFLAEKGANIVDAQQHTDRIERVFFMRVEFDPPAGLPLQSFGEAFGPLAAGFGMRWRLRSTGELPTMGIMVSRQEHCLIDLLSRHRIGELRVRIPLIISNHEILKPLADAFGVPFTTVPVSPDSRAHAEERAVDLFQQARCDFIVLARYMQNTESNVPRSLSPCRNQHPSQLSPSLRRRPRLPTGARTGREADRGHEPLRHRDPG